MSKSEKQKDLISKELYKAIRAGTVIPTTIVVAIVGVSCTQQSESVEVESESETTQQITFPQQAQETSAVAQTETTEVKEFENIIPITLISDESLTKIRGEWEGKTYIPKEIVYREPVEESKKAMEKAFLLTWAYILRNKDPDFQNIPIENHDLLISTLVEKLNKGEDLTFEIPLKDNYSYLAKEQHITPYKVDLSKGVTLIFVGEVTGIEGKKGDLPTSRDFAVLQYSSNEEDETIIGVAVRKEVTENGTLTIKLFVDHFRPEGWASFIATCLETLIDPKRDYHTRGRLLEEKHLMNVLIPGNEWVDPQMTKMTKWGTPILDIIYQE